MRFILLIEENGYELRYWDEIAEEIGDSIVFSWDIEDFYKKLNVMNFNITKKALKDAIKIIENSDKNFVILGSKDTNKLDTLHNNIFVVED